MTNWTFNQLIDTWHRRLMIYPLETKWASTTLTMITETLRSVSWSSLRTLTLGMPLWCRMTEVVQAHLLVTPCHAVQMLSHNHYPTWTLREPLQRIIIHIQTWSTKKTRWSALCTRARCISYPISLNVNVANLIKSSRKWSWMSFCANIAARMRPYANEWMMHWASIIPN